MVSKIQMRLNQTDFDMDFDRFDSNNEAAFIDIGGSVFMCMLERNFEQQSIHFNLNFMQISKPSIEQACRLLIIKLKII